MQTDAKVKEVK